MLHASQYFLGQLYSVYAFLKSEFGISGLKLDAPSDKLTPLKGRPDSL